LVQAEQGLAARRLVLDHDRDVRHVRPELSRERVERLLRTLLEVDVEDGTILHASQCRSRPPSFDTPILGDATSAGCADGEKVAMAELTDPPSGKPLVLRVEISAEGGGELSLPALDAGLRALAPARPARDEEAERRAAELERREEKLDELERRLNERELELEAGSGNTASEKIRLASREKRVAQTEEELEERLREVDEREDALETREAEFEADVELREQRIERWRTELTELEQRLDRKETELTLYVGELQGELAKREPSWWPADRPVRHH
jgi:hypothetical protein